MSLQQKLTEERRGRLAAERMLELKKAELFAANRKLGRNTRELSDEIVDTRALMESMGAENLKVKSDLTAAHEKIAVVERRLWHSIETIKDGFAFFDGDNRLIMANQAYLTIFDRSGGYPDRGQLCNYSSGRYRRRDCRSGRNGAYCMATAHAHPLPDASPRT